MVSIPVRIANNLKQTTDKMYRIISDFDISITHEIEKLIDVVRHKTVHRGEIGEGREGLITFHLLNELIREIILRMVDYKGERKSQILLRGKSTTHNRVDGSAIK